MQNMKRQIEVNMKESGAGNIPRETIRDLFGNENETKRDDGAKCDRGLFITRRLHTKSKAD